MSLSAKYDEFISAFLPPDEPAVQQRRQLRIAFFAGCASALREITEIPDDPTPDKAPPRHKLITNLQAAYAEVSAETYGSVLKQ
jgi:hypothetical protein